ncbi:hypothetical protein NPIL_278291 [Nephila pilipes]|uniref:Uncharacterized protein n=1 Tax=Nephila pilipes TaxID=299642 RepID=A0A8X6MXH4_NEPPI|nr:hypothetical protein NPIL_278291 [Nephila pilipes]
MEVNPPSRMATMRISPVIRNPDFDKKSLVIPDSEIKGVTQIEEQVEIDLSHTKRDMALDPHNVRIYHPRERDEGVAETDGLDGERSRAEQVETEGSKGLAREETSRKEKWRGKRMMSEGSTESSNNKERRHRSKRRPPVRRNWRKLSAPSSLVENSEVKRLPHGSCKWSIRPILVSLPSQGASVDNQVLSGRSSPGPPQGATDNHRQVLPGRSSPCRLSSRRHIKEGQEESRR